MPLSLPIYGPAKAEMPTPSLPVLATAPHPRATRSTQLSFPKRKTRGRTRRVSGQPCRLLSRTPLARRQN
eukprot:1687013-Pyramimonas_sp.AAC.1